jgi:hypothetical protein
MMENNLDRMMVGGAVGLVLVIAACTIRLRDDACEITSSSFTPLGPRAPSLGPSHTVSQETDDALRKCAEGRTATGRPFPGEGAAPSTLSDHDGCQARPVLGLPQGDDSRSFAIPAPQGR